MARGTTLTQLLTMLRAEAGHSLSVAAGVDVEPILILKLQRTQQMLYDNYDWPFLNSEWPIQMEAGQRYYDFPSTTELNPVVDEEGIQEVWIDYSGRPVPLTRGIGQFEYAQYNSNAAVPDRADPVRKWDIKRPDGSSKEQIEAWPIPAGSTNIMTIKGKKRLRPLVAASDTCDLDDLLIVLTLAAEMLAEGKKANYKKVEAAAAARLSQLRLRAKGGTRQINMAGPNRANNNLGKTIIRIGSQTN